MANKQKFPLVSAKDLYTDGWKIPFQYAMYRAAEHFKKPERERVTLSDNIIHGYLDEVGKINEQKYKIGFDNTFPLVSAYKGFANDPTIIDTMYTVEAYDHEFPVFVRDKNDSHPTDKMLSTAIETVRDQKKSPYDERNKTDKFYYQPFDIKAAPKYTRGDISNEALFPEPLRFRRWFVMDDMWRIQQYGKIKEEKPITIDGTTYTVRHYEKPDKWNSFIYWAIGDKIYDAIDGPFDIVQEKIIKTLPPPARQYITKEEYKMIARVRRSFFTNFSRKPLVFDLTEEPGYHNAA